MTGGPDSAADGYCGAFPGLSAAGARMACTAGQCPAEEMCRALRRLEQEAGLARAHRDASARYVEELLAASRAERREGRERRERRGRPPGPDGAGGSGGAGGGGSAPPPSSPPGMRPA
jgi:hypothetical protein